MVFSLSEKHNKAEKIRTKGKQQTRVFHYDLKKLKKKSEANFSDRDTLPSIHKHLVLTHRNMSEDGPEEVKNGLSQYIDVKIAKGDWKVAYVVLVGGSLFYYKLITVCQLIYFLFF